MNLILVNGGEKLDGDSTVCLECAGGDAFIAQRIAANNVVAPCAICGEVKASVTVEALAEMVDTVCKKYMRDDRGRGLWNDNGSTPNELIRTEILECDSEELTDAIVEILSDAEGYRVMHDGEMPLYDATSSTYELIVPHSGEFEERWERFEEGVKHRGRFLLDHEREYLEEIFGPVLRGELHQGEPPFVLLGTEDAGIKAVYRARAANTVGEKKRILENPSRELSPPPPALRTAGRMNAAGVLAFYGATDVTTCIAELAIPIGGAAFVGRFEFLQPARVLDLRLLSRAALRTSFFDPDFQRSVEYGLFMRGLRDRLRKPVLREAEALEYLPTQMVAEFLASKGLDGVMFVSSVTTAAEEEARYEDDPDSWVRGEAEIARTTGVNIVLFSRSAVVINDMGPPIRRVKKIEPVVYFGDVSDGWFYVEVTDAPNVDTSEPIPYPMFDDAVAPTLQLIEDSVVLAEPKSIDYKVATVAPTYGERGEGIEF